MKKKVGLVLGLLAIVILLTVCSWPSIRERMWENRVRPRQEELAKELGVRIEDYPHPIAFPIGYFDSVLKLGMTHDEVHKIVKGYTDVVNCFGSVELYDYFGPDDNLAIQIMVLYGKDGKFEELRVDTPDDRTLGADETCSYGLLGE